MMNKIPEWLAGNWIEVLAVLISLTYIILSVRQIIWLWLFGLISAVLYSWIYYDSGFYAGMSLQGYYIFISIYGWIIWSRGKGTQSGAGELRVRHLNYKMGSILGSVWLILWLVIAIILNRWTDSTIPVWDALTTAGGIVATWMLARKILETWVLWIFVDSVSVVLYVWKGLYPTTILFLVYIIMAIVGYREWKRTLART